MYSPNSVAKFIKDLTKLKLNLTQANCIEEAVNDADLIITCTTNSQEQLIKFAWLKPGNLAVFSIGGMDFSTEEIPKFNCIVSDDKVSLIARNAGSLPNACHQGLLDSNRIKNLNELFSQNTNLRGQQIFFSPVGLACHDLIIAERIYKYAIVNNLGHELDIFDAISWI